MDAKGKGTAVYVCHCGHNIAATVDVEAVAETIASLDGVEVARHYPYLCSRPGQELIRADLRAGRISRVVVAACSPRMHEATFRKAVAAEGLNPYLFQHVNIREQCSWVHPEKERATVKASALVRGGLERVRLQDPLFEAKAEVASHALVVGAGPAGLAAAAQLASTGVTTTLCEASKEPGGRAARVGRSFPEGGKVGPWLDTLIDSVRQNQRVELLTQSRVVGLSGVPGSFEATISTPEGELTRTVGAIILATGHDLYQPDDPDQGRPELGYGADPRVVTQEWLEDALRADDGQLRVEGEEVKSVAFLQCIGSRDQTAQGGHCSRVCCMVSVRQAAELREKNPGCDVQVIYMDLRAYARGAEEAYEEAGRQGVIFRRGSASEIFGHGPRRTVCFEDTLTGEARQLEAELVVLACGVRPRSDTREAARLFGAAQGPDGFFQEAHPKLRPSETASDGLFLAGSCQGPKTIDEAVTSGRAAAAKAAITLLRGWTQIDPVVSQVDDERCTGCGLCAKACPFGALDMKPHRPVMAVTAALCKGCGACAAACPSQAITLRHYRPDQILAELNAYLDSE